MNTELINDLLQITILQWLAILFVVICASTAIWSILTYTIIAMANTATKQNKKLLDNIKKLDDEHKYE
jgi:hypothetical protein